METNRNNVAACWAPEIFVKLLGGSLEEWDAYFTDNQLLDECEREIPFTKIRGEVFYDLSNLYRYVFHHAPEVLGLGSLVGVGSVAGSSFSCKASIAVNYERGGALAVELEAPEQYTGRPLMSPEAARQLAAELLEAASACDSHAFDVVKWAVVPHSELSTIPKKFGRTTGDVELDLLLAQLEGETSECSGVPCSSKGAH